MANNTNETFDVDEFMDRLVTIRKGDQKLHVLLTYTALNALYSGEACLMAIHGKEDAGPNDLGTIVFPIRAKDVEIEDTVHDAQPFSYSNLKGGVIRLRHVTAKIASVAGVIPSSCTLTVDVPSVDSNWVPRTKNVTLVVASGVGPDGVTNKALFNPHGMAEWGRYLFFIDYETRCLVRVRKSLLEAAGDGGNVVADTYDMSEYLEGNANARGQAVIIMNNKLYALFLIADINAAAGSFLPGKLLRLAINSDGTLEAEAVTQVGRNAQSISPINVGGVVYLLVQAIGGRQLFTGGTNGTESNICVVEAEGEWPLNADIKITGDVCPVSPSGDPAPTAYDIIAIGAAMRNDQSLVYILTRVFNKDALSAFWRMYVCTAADFLGLTGTGPNPPTLTEATQIAGGTKFKKIDEGLVIAPTILVQNVPIPYGVYFWGLLYEQALGSDASEDRLWVGVGSPFQVCKATKYSSPTTAPDYPYVVISGMGGKNVNGWQSLIETLHQAIRKVSLNRGMQGMKIALQPPKPSADSDR
jgi:hypothetical protein